MWAPESFKTKIVLLSITTVITLAIHYGWVIEPLFGHVHWAHAIHGRLCYIPIAIAASWFGLRGGLLAATVISLLVLPYIFGSVHDPNDFAGEIAEIFFYFAIAALIGVLVEREFTARRKQQEAELQMERSHKLSLIGQIAAGVAHEIKNPLASIKGAADILTDDDTSREEREEFKEILQNETRRMDATVAEFLEFARPKETRLAQLDLTRSVRASLRQIDAHARREGIAIETELEDGIMINGDQEKLHQMMLNLILNAIAASKKDDSICVSLKRADGRGSRIVIADSGTGIDERDMERIFEPFFTTRSSGTGLGLAIVKGIVDNHSGDIVVESSPGRGTTVTVTFPDMKAGERE